MFPFRMRFNFMSNISSFLSFRRFLCIVCLKSAHTRHCSTNCLFWRLSSAVFNALHFTFISVWVCQSTALVKNQLSDDSNQSRKPWNQNRTSVVPLVACWLLAVGCWLLFWVACVFVCVSLGVCLSGSQCSAGLELLLLLGWVPCASLFALGLKWP